MNPRKDHRRSRWNKKKKGDRKQFGKKPRRLQFRDEDNQIQSFTFEAWNDEDVKDLPSLEEK